MMMMISSGCSSSLDKNNSCNEIDAGCCLKWWYPFSMMMMIPWTSSSTSRTLKTFSYEQCNLYGNASQGLNQSNPFDKDILSPVGK
jgi:hypothetical protein